MFLKFAENLLERIRERQGFNCDQLISGSPKNMEEYKLIIGKYRGLIEAEEIAKQMIKDLTEINEEPNDDRASTEYYE